jgi:hypothetical protein
LTGLLLLGISKSRNFLKGNIVASATKKLKVRRALRVASCAKKRKNADRRHGSTAANLPLSKPNANEMAMNKAV